MKSNSGPKNKLSASPSPAPAPARGFSPQSRMLDAEGVCAKLIANGKENPTLSQLLETTAAMRELGKKDAEAVRAMHLFSCAWARHFRNSTFSEFEASIPALNRFTDSLFLNRSLATKTSEA